MKLVRRLSLCTTLLAASAAAFAPNEPARVAPDAPELSQTVRDLAREEEAARAELEQLGRDSELLRGRTLARSRAYVKLARAGLLPAGGGFQAFVEHAARLERLHRALARDLELERSTLARRTALARRVAELAARRAPLEAEQRALDRAQEMLAAARDRELAFQRAFQSGSFDDHTAVYGALGNDSLTPSRGGFAAQRGQLPFPLAGRTEIKHVERSAARGPGLEMRAPLGSAVRAVYPGRVAFADTYAEYGKAIILDHGANHYTVSANLKDIDVRTGDEVRGGERIGTVGDAPAGPHLYFEVRIGQETADPAAWFGI